MEIGPCIEWKGAKNAQGYAYTSVKHRAVRASRFFWEKAHGKIPDGLFVLHKCDNPACVNIDHLFLGTNQDNMDDMIAKGRSHLVKLCADQVREIRAARSNGESAASLSLRFPVMPKQIRRICKRTAWKNV